MIAAVCTTYNEADIIGHTVGHLLGSGVDHIYIADASTDGTRGVIDSVAGNHATILDDRMGFHNQPLWTKLLADLARAEGHNWIIPFDADEFVCIDGGDFQWLNTLDDYINKLFIPMQQYVNWNERWVENKPLPKVICRWKPDLVFAPGNHGCNIPFWYPARIVIKELQYRSYNHFKRKIRERCQTLDPRLHGIAGDHHWNLKDATEDQLEQAWQELHNHKLIYDPIPVRASV